MDTAKDTRILVLEDALRRLNEIIGNRKLKLHIEYGKLNELLKSAGSLFYEVKYSYTEPEKIVELPSMRGILDSMKELEEIYRKAIDGFKPQSSKEMLVIAEMEYAFRIIKGFPERMVNRNDDPAYAVDILAVEISQTKPIEGSKNLTECRCSDGKKIWNIATNISNIRSSSKMVCAILPPVEMMDVVSEAMFLGGETLPDDSSLGKMEMVPPSALDQARAQVMQITKRMR